MSKTIFDMSTLDLADGTHTVKVKAKADGYRDSEFSNEVEYTKAGGYTFNITALGEEGSSNRQTFFKYNTPPTSFTDLSGGVLSNGSFSGHYPDGSQFSLSYNDTINVVVNKLYLWGYKIIVNGAVYTEIESDSPVAVSENANIKIYALWE